MFSNFLESQNGCHSFNVATVFIVTGYVIFCFRYYQEHVIHCYYPLLISIGINSF